MGTTFVEEPRMRHRISAGVIAEVADRVLLVRHHEPGAYDFWVPPGGGAEGTEDLRETVRREAREECGLEIEPMQMAYVEDLWSPGLRICKVWFIGRVTGGALAPGAGGSTEHIVDAQFVSRGELRVRLVFPLVLRERYWSDRTRGFSSPRYLGIRPMEIY